MEEISVGDYVRTYKGKIYKVTNVYVLKVTCGHTSLRYSDITKHSPNIIDLIETGDYVNGRKMKILKRDIFQGEKRLVFDSGFGYEAWFYENQIEDIVTHEQYNSIKYFIGE